MIAQPIVDVMTALGDYISNMESYHELAYLAMQNPLNTNIAPLKATIEANIRDSLDKAGERGMNVEPERRDFETVRKKFKI